MRVFVRLAISIVHAHLLKSYPSTTSHQDVITRRLPAFCISSFIISVILHEDISCLFELYRKLCSVEVCFMLMILL